MSQTDLIIHDEKDNVAVVVIETTKKAKIVALGSWKMTKQLKLVPLLKSH